MSVKRGRQLWSVTLEQASVEAVAAAIKGSDAVVFAAGAGPGSGAERKLTMDRDRRAQAASGGDFFECRALRDGERGGRREPSPVATRSSRSTCGPRQKPTRRWKSAIWTGRFSRPGGLTDDTGTGNVRIETTPFSGPVPRDDVAAVLAALLAERRSSGRIIYLSSGSTPIGEALSLLLD